jgi:FkbM family methyltransferase
MLRKITKNIIAGRQSLQPLWARLNRLSLLGMNIGGGSSLIDQGEIWVIDYFGKTLPKGQPGIVFDVGSNAGYYAAEMLSRLGDRVKIYCFEPSKKTFELLEKKLEHFENKQLFNFGFGDKEGSATLYSDDEVSGLASLYNRRLDHLGIKMGHTEVIQVKTLDDFCRDSGIERVNFLKLDVEGHELKVLNGAQNLIHSNSIDFIQFEFGGCNVESRTFFRDFFYLLNSHYKIYRILKDGLALIEVYNEACEIFLYANYLAVSRKL